MNKHETITILMAEDDADDRLLAVEALEESRLRNELYCVNDGVELLDFLKRQGEYADLPMPRVGVILLDLNMPRMDGREVLDHIKADQNLRSIPVVVLTTSKSEEDILHTYDMGVSGYITKPVSFQGLVDVMKSLGNYWFEIVKLPN